MLSLFVYRMSNGAIWLKLTIIDQLFRSLPGPLKNTLKYHHSLRASLWGASSVGSKTCLPESIALLLPGGVGGGSSIKGDSFKVLSSSNRYQSLSSFKTVLLIITVKDEINKIDPMIIAMTFFIFLIW